MISWTSFSLSNREVSVALENSAFERTHVENKMKVIGPVE